MTDVTISICLATFNGAKYIREQLHSINNQSLLPNEIIISDDNSTDNTLEIIKNFKWNKDINVIVLDNQINVGYTQNFSNALTKASCELVFLCDQDDYWYENKLASMVQVFCNKGSPKYFALRCDADITDENLNKIGITKMESIVKSGGTIENFVQGSCYCFSNEIIKMITPIPVNVIGHDNWLSYFTRYVYCGNELLGPLQCYRRHEMATSKYTTLEKIKRRTSFDTSIFGKKRSEKMAYALYSHKLILKRIKLNLNSGSLNRSDLIVRHENIEDLINIYNLRLKIIGSGYFCRIYWIFKLQSLKGYQHFQGILSLAQDIIRSKYALVEKEKK